MLTSSDDSVKLIRDGIPHHKAISHHIQAHRPNIIAENMGVRLATATNAGATAIITNKGNELPG